MKKKYVLTNKKRFIIIICVLISVIISTTVLVTRRPEGKSNEVYQEHLVKYGDTLWDIATDITDGSKDIRRVIFEIKKINDLSTPDLCVGQLIKLPTY